MILNSFQQAPTIGESVIRGGYGVVAAQDPVEVSGRVQIPLATPDDVWA